ncbi:hypothetical protein LAV79_21020 [Peribacillus butanolivorans]|uniref:hypothetical protein n=1 Tax=Peribacillus butanolivorans TaxID=421767 RepID=UPI0030C8EE96
MKVWIKIATSIGLITIGLLIGSFTNLMNLGDNPEVFFPSNQDEMGPNQMPPSDQEEGSDEDREWGKAGPN